METPVQVRDDALEWPHVGIASLAVLVIEAETPDWLEPLARTLRHYKRQSWLVGLKGKIMDRGVWPAGPSPLTVRFD